MYTPFGKKQRDNLLTLANLGDKMLDALRPVVEKVPNTVIERVKSSGTGENKKSFSAYNPDYARKTGKSGHKDFWISGTMWGSYQIVKEEVTGTGVSFTLGTTDGKGSDGQFLSDIHSAERKKHKRGGTQGEGQLILGITDEEWEKLQNQMMEALRKEFDKYL